MKKKSSAEVPNDYIQWTLRDAVRHGDNPYDPDDMVTERLAGFYVELAAADPEHLYA